MEGEAMVQIEDSKPLDSYLFLFNDILLLTKISKKNSSKSNAHSFSLKYQILLKFVLLRTVNDHMGLLFDLLFIIFLLIIYY